MIRYVVRSEDKTDITHIVCNICGLDSVRVTIGEVGRRVLHMTLNQKGTFQYVRTYRENGGGGVKSLIHFHCVLHSKKTKRGGGGGSR